MHKVKRVIKATIVLFLPLFDVLMSPFVFLSALLLWVIRAVIGVQRMKVSKYIFNKVGVFPIKDHYYEPLFNPAHLQKPLNADRYLPAIDLNVDEQLKILHSFDYAEELRRIPLEKGTNIEYYYHNKSFESGDGEYLYNMVRKFKPKRIVEIGSGFSTLAGLKAIDQNKKEDPSYKCDYFCIEPYEMKWLEKTGVTVVRELVEKVDINIFRGLTHNDFLFIDSSHMIRPQGDVVTEYLEILPNINPGVIVHIHDIFTPKDYPKQWVVDEVRLWNEQYLFEAFLSFNKEFKVIGAVNFLKHNYFKEIAVKCPVLGSEPFREPASFWMQKV
jgi:hypothetical protein